MNHDGTFSTCSSACSTTSMISVGDLPSPKSTPITDVRSPIAAFGTRCTLGVSYMLHDLMHCMKLACPLVDNSAEVLVAAQRLVDAYPGATCLHLGAAVALATKLLSTQYREPRRLLPPSQPPVLSSPVTGRVHHDSALPTAHHDPTTIYSQGCCPAPSWPVAWAWACAART